MQQCLAEYVVPMLSNLAGHSVLELAEVIGPML